MKSWARKFQRSRRSYRTAQIIAEIQRKDPSLLKRISPDRILQKANEIAQERRQQG